LIKGRVTILDSIHPGIAMIEPMTTWMSNDLENEENGGKAEDAHIDQNNT